MLWDWAEQPYPTIIQTFIFATYITSTSFVAAGSSVDSLAAQLGLAGAIAGAVVAITAPIFGRRSDSSGSRKRWLLINSGILILLMVASYFVEPNPSFFIFGLALYAIGNVVQETAFINYYAMMKQVTNENNMAKISGVAWALGYVGGIILLMGSLVLCFLPGHPIFPSEENGLNIRTIFLFAAVWMFVFTIPLALFVPEVPKSDSTKKESIAQSYRGMFNTISKLRRENPDALRFLLASAVYRDGLAGVFTYGAVLGTIAFGFSQTGVILFGVAANIVSGIGALLGGYLDNAYGTKKVISFSLIGMLVAGTGVFALASYGSITYWIFGLALCLFVGPAQASSRTFVARFAPMNREGEIFGLYQTTGRAASFLSPTLWAVSISIAASLGFANATLFGILGIMVVLAAGCIWLFRVHPNPRVIE